MIAEINSRMFRPHAVNMGMRQQVASRTSTGMSKRMTRMVTLIIGVSLFVVFAVSQVMHWHIVASANQFEKLQSVRIESGSRNIELLATRAKLASQEFVEMLNESQWHLRMKPAQIVREAVVEYLKRHLPKDAKSKLLKDR